MTTKVFNKAGLPKVMKRIEMEKMIAFSYSKATTALLPLPGTSHKKGKRNPIVTDILCRLTAA